MTSIPDGRKENFYYIVSENNNKLRSTTGKSKQYPDDCCVWDSSKGHTVNSYFVVGEDNNVKYLSLRDGLYCTQKTISGRKTYEKIVPQPSAESVLTLSRYYMTLKRSNQYKRRVLRLQSSDNTQSSIAIVEYTGKYPDENAPHGNAKHQNKSQILERIASVARSNNPPRDFYKSMVLENSFEAPKDFKQVRNVKYQQSRKDTKYKIGHKNNLADEVLHCIPMVCSIVQKQRIECPILFATPRTNAEIWSSFCLKKVITQLELTEHSIWAVFCYGFSLQKSNGCPC